MNLSATINYKLLPIKAHFFFFFAACAPILPFLPIYAKQLGIDAIGVGVIFAGKTFLVNKFKFTSSKEAYMLENGKIHDCVTNAKERVRVYGKKQFLTYTEKIEIETVC